MRALLGLALLVGGCASSPAHRATKAFLEDDFDRVTYPNDEGRLWTEVRAELVGRGFQPSEPKSEWLSSTKVLVTDARESVGSGDKYVMGTRYDGATWWYEVRVDREGERLVLRVHTATERSKGATAPRAREVEHCILRRLDPGKAHALEEQWRARVIAVPGTPASPWLDHRPCADGRTVDP